MHVAQLQPTAWGEQVTVWPAELLQLAQEQQRQQQQSGGSLRLGGGSLGLGGGSLSLVVGQATERLELTISLEPWLQSQPAPRAPEPGLAPVCEPAVVVEEAPGPLPPLPLSPFQPLAASPAPACSGHSMAAAAPPGDEMLLPTPAAVPSRMPASGRDDPSPTPSTELLRNAMAILALPSNAVSAAGEHHLLCAPCLIGACHCLWAVATDAHGPAAPCCAPPVAAGAGAL